MHEREAELAVEGKGRGPDGNGYLLADQAPEAGARLEALAELYDPSTFRHFADLGVDRGWRCWEVGAGGGSVIKWLARRVGGEGRVLATDIDLSWAKGESGPGVEVIAHDVGLDPPPPEAFDLVHARLVLVHVVRRERALRSMAGALRPGGWLVIEDADPALQPLACLDEAGPDAELANRLRAGFRQLMSGRGVDLAYGRKLPGLLRGAGLVDVEADAYFPVARPACSRLEMATVSLLRHRLVDAGLARPAEIERHLDNVSAGRIDLAQPPMITAWGRRAR
jgi:SAM-dependent methyltransferase